MSGQTSGRKLLVSFHIVTQLLQAGHAQMGRTVVHPGMVWTIQPHGLHARIQCPQHIQARVVANVQNMFGGNINSARRCMKNPRIGLGTPNPCALMLARK